MILAISVVDCLIATHTTKPEDMGAGFCPRPFSPNKELG